MSLTKIVEQSISKLGENYLRNKRSYLTEADTVYDLFSVLRNNLDLEKMRIHSELRPFYGEIDCPSVIRTIKGTTGWVMQKTALQGSLVDLSIIDVCEEHWNKAYKKAQKDQGLDDLEHLRFWRMLSYPVEAFRAIIEVKFKVYKNIGRIKKDIDKLDKIREKNHECLVYLVILDRRAKKLGQIEKYSQEKNINCIVFRSS